MATAEQAPTFSEEKQAQLAALLSEQAAANQYAKEQARLTQKATFAPLAEVLTEGSVNALLSALRDVKPNLTGEAFEMASNLITVLDHGGLGLARTIKLLDTPAEVPIAPVITAI